MGVALHLIAVHIGTGVSLVSVTDDIFYITLFLSCNPPFQPGRETGTASTPESGLLYFFKDLVRMHFGESKICC